MPSVAWGLTIDKLKDILALVNKSIETGNYSNSKEAVSSLKNYRQCFYCVGYRTMLESHTRGCCDGCPLHQYAENTTGRDIPWNGCYKIPFYREMVRLAWSYATSPNEVDAKALVVNIQKCIDGLIREKDIV